MKAKETPSGRRTGTMMMENRDRSGLDRISGTNENVYLSIDK
jgi:hypothetical protein